MLNKEKSVSVSGAIILLLIFLNAFVLKIAFIQSGKWYVALVITLPLLFVAVMYDRHKKHTDITNSLSNDKLVD